MALLIWLKDISTNSRSLCISPVEMTKSSGLYCWNNMSYIACNKSRQTLSNESDMNNSLYRLITST
jgi:hypothetical protein